MLRGTIGQARDRADLIRQAEEQGAAYYGTECVSVTLSDEKAETEYQHTLEGSVPTRTDFSADYTANIEHQWSKPSYGFPKCHKCGLDDYNR